MAVIAPASMGGVLNINKEANWTSFDVVSVVRRLLKIRRVGHCGTLDPFATGVLPIFVGRSTGLVRFTENYDKRYRVTYAIGRATETEDLTGATCGGRTPNSAEIAALQADDWAVLRRHVAALVGQQDQIPPMYSAVKVGGRKLYEYARKGETVLRPVRRIEVYEAKFVSAQVVRDAAPVRLTIDIHCSKGTYVRTLGSDIGQRLGWGAHAVALTRTACGFYNLADSIMLSELEAWLARQPEEFRLAINGQIPQIEGSPFFAPESALRDLTVIKLNANESRRLLQGQTLRLSADGVEYKSGMRLCTYGPHGFLGVARCKQVYPDGIIISAERMLANLDDYQS
ncbi:MAG TPA: tRNA pseudouridine(55) synthase TruB [Clostridiaceae bacterium]|nr:tRNA pseudouridine(55) synthase TruB [Clostridiaceae bacterium]